MQSMHTLQVQHDFMLHEQYAQEYYLFIIYLTCLFTILSYRYTYYLQNTVGSIKEFIKENDQQRTVMSRLTYNDTAIPKNARGQRENAEMKQTANVPRKCFRIISSSCSRSASSLLGKTELKTKTSSPCSFIMTF